MRRRVLSRALIALALAATPALAAPTSPFFVMGEPCQLDTSTANGGKWSAFGTNVLTASTAQVPTFPGALCSAKATLVSGQTTYDAVNLSSGQSTYTLTCHMYVDTVPSVETRIADFYNTTSSASTAILTLVPINSMQFRLRTSYRDESTYICSGAAKDGVSVDGTECTPTADEACSGVDRDLTNCPENNHCEARCDKRSYATATHSKGQWLTWTMQQENGSNAEVAVRLWSGAGSYPTASYARGGGFQTVGFCASGTHANLACLTNTDCPSSTCTTTKKLTVERIRLGKSDTGTGTGTIYFAKCFGYAGSTAYPNQTWDTLTPSGTVETGKWVHQGTETECTDANIHLCLNDGSAPDADTSAIKNSVASQPTAAINWSAISTPTPAPTPLAVAFESLWKDQESAASGRTIDLEFVDGATATTDYTPYELNWTDDGASAAYYQVPDLITTNSTILADTSLTTRIQQTDSASREGRMTAGWVSVIRQTAAPTTISTVPDVTGDGQRTVRFVGDSISANDDYQSTLNDNFALLNVDNLDFCAFGGTMPLDVADNFFDMADDGAPSYMACNKVKRGTSGKRADVIVLMSAVNAWHGALSSVPANLSGVEGGWAQDGLCETASGAGTGQGQACRCPSSTFQRRTDVNRGRVRPCMTKGSGAGAFGASCSATADCTCSSNADCTFAGFVGRCGACIVNSALNGSYCTANADCGTGGVCDTDRCTTAPYAIGDACKIGNRNLINWPTPSTWCGYGCNDAPGCSGWCMTTPALGDVTSDFETIDAIALPTPVPTPPLGGAPIKVYMTEPSPEVGSGGVGCYAGAKHHVENFNLWLRKWTAASSTRRFIDVAAYLDRKCPVRNRTCSDETCCYTDTVHPNAYGQRLMAEIIYRAFANLDGTHDGTCSAGSCTTGKRGDACSSNADCDYYRMDLTPS